MSLSKQDIDQITAAMVCALDSRSHTCNTEHCKEVCDLTPPNHSADHKWIYQFKKRVFGMNNQFFTTSINAFILFVFWLLGMGVFYIIEHHK